MRWPVPEWKALRAWLAVLGLAAGCGGDPSPSQPAAAERRPTFIPETSASIDDRGTPIGRFVHTFYWTEFESDYSGRADTELVGPDCRVVAAVPRAFADRICVEGSGKLTSGLVLNLSGECSCGYRCPDTGGSVCFFPLSDEGASWGYGSDGNPLVPLRSVAIQETVVAHGTVLYIPQWDGV